MKIKASSSLSLVTATETDHHRLPWPPALRVWRASGGIAVTAIAIGSLPPTLAAPIPAPLAVSQALPAPILPVPYASSEPFAGEQYLVLVNGSSDLLLDQVRQIEPDAFVNSVDGTSVIQAGRFSSFQNAQLRVNELATLGVGARVQSTTPVSASIPVTNAADYAIATPIGTPGDLPPLPIAASPSAVEFGQASPFQTVPPPVSSSALPPPTSAYPANTVPPPINTPVVAAPASTSSGYYVVVPGGTAELQSLANQVVSLGAAPSLVQMRMAPRGPHIAVGPYDERGIAEEWSSYLRGHGLGARVHFE